MSEVIGNGRVVLVLDPGAALAAQGDLGYDRPDLSAVGLRRSGIAPVDVLDVRYPLIMPYDGRHVVLDGYGRFCEAACRGIGIEVCVAASPDDLRSLPDECFLSRDLTIAEAREQVAGTMKLLPLYRKDARARGVDTIADLVRRVGYGICVGGFRGRDARYPWRG